MSSASVIDQARSAYIGVDGISSYMKIDDSTIFTVNDRNVTINGNLEVSGSLGQSLINSLFQALYPIGAYYISMNEIPGTKTPNGSTFTIEWNGCTWKYQNDQRFLRSAPVTISGNTVTLGSSGSVGGEAAHQLKVEEMPSHAHSISHYGFHNTAWSSDTPDQCMSRLPITTDGEDKDVCVCKNTGGGQAHNNLPPYIDVYINCRIA